MKLHEFHEGQAVDYYAYSVDGYLQKWQHGHISGIDDDPRFPLIFIDVTVYDYRPDGKAVEPDKVRPATTQCTAQASCQELKAKEG